MSEIPIRRLLHHVGGASLVEFTLVFPVFIAVALGTVDMVLMIFEMGSAAKATQLGARTAIVTTPVANNVSAPYSAAALDTKLGQDCFSEATGSLDTANCLQVNAVCSTSTSDAGSCPGFSSTGAPFQRILTSMQRAFPRITAANVRVTYTSTGLGFVGRPGGTPLNVTVELKCMTHHLAFMGGLVGWLFPAGCEGAPAGMPIPSFRATLVSEAMESE